MKHFYIITNSIKDPGLKFTEEVCAQIRAHGAEAVPGHLHPEIPEDTDFVLVLGGDGSVLQAAARLGDRHIPVLGVNLGTLGYLAEIEKKNFPAALEQLLSGDYMLEERMMLDGICPDAGGNTPRVHTALNDVVFVRKGPLRIENYYVYVNGQFLNSFNADGIIVSTPTGSTAYNLSAGGPIVEPSARIILMTPICPHTLNNRSIVLSAQDQVEVRIGRTSTESCLEAEADFDGSDSVTLRTGDRVQISQSKRTLCVAKLSRRSFLETLHKKLM